MIIIISIK